MSPRPIPRRCSGARPACRFDAIIAGRAKSCQAADEFVVARRCGGLLSDSPSRQLIAGRTGLAAGGMPFRWRLCPRFFFRSFRRAFPAVLGAPVDPRD
jgi:hypothetical protein